MVIFANLFILFDRNGSELETERSTWIHPARHRAQRDKPYLDVEPASFIARDSWPACTHVYTLEKEKLGSRKIIPEAFELITGER